MILSKPQRFCEFYPHGVSRTNSKLKYHSIIYQFRIREGYKQEYFAMKIKVSQQAVSKWECGASFPSPDKIEQLLKIIGCSLTDFLENYYLLQKLRAESETKGNDKDETA